MLDEQENFVPALIDVSDAGTTTPGGPNSPASLMRTDDPDEFIWRRSSKSVTTKTKPKQLKNETLGGPNSTSYFTIGTESMAEAVPSFNRSAELSSNRRYVMNGLLAMEKRINQLEREKAVTERNFDDLQHGIDTYTALLMKNQRILAHRDSSSTNNNEEINDLLNDKSIQRIYESLQQRLTQLEKKRAASSDSGSEKNTGPFTRSQKFENVISTAGSTSSEIEKTRGAPASNSDPKNLSIFSHFEPVLPSLNYVDLAERSGKNHSTKGRTVAGGTTFTVSRGSSNEKIDHVIVPPNLTHSFSSLASSKSLKLDENQRKNLSKLTEKLRSGELLPQAASSPLPKSTSFSYPQYDNRSAQCDPYDCVDKSAQCSSLIGQQTREKKDLSQKSAQTTFFIPSRTESAVSYENSAKQKKYLAQKSAQTSFFVPSRPESAVSYDNKMDERGRKRRSHEYKQQRPETLYRPSLPIFSKPSPSSPSIIDSDSRMDYDRLHLELKLLKENAREAALMQEKRELEAKKPITQSRSSSAPSSPARKISKREISADAKLVQPVFVAGMSTESSHSLRVNLQELLSSLKRQNPALHQVALKMDSEVSLMTLAEAFDKELRRLKRKAEKELKALLREYDEISEQNKENTNQNVNSERAKKENALVAEMEQKDTYIQRLNTQLSWLNFLPNQNQSGFKRKLRACESDCATSSGASPASRGFTHHLTKHTVASKQKAAPRAAKKPYEPMKHVRFAQILKEIRLIKDVMNNNSDSPR